MFRRLPRTTPSAAVGQAGADNLPWFSPIALPAARMISTFSNVHTFKAEIECGLGLEISDVEREVIGRPRNADHIKKEIEWRWTFDCQEGDFSFVSAGYEQFTRIKPIRAKSQSFDWEERGGVSFDRTTFEKSTSEPGASDNADKPRV